MAELSAERKKFRKMQEEFEKLSPEEQAKQRKQASESPLLDDWQPRNVVKKKASQAQSSKAKKPS